ncbi:MAG: hypothetical protein J6M20_05090 [Clostridia bacterium]|nr:hypothetical protein [Clostridia bacterium]MBQ7305296.1 hypothetical protein [Clostridia bacterium]
MLKSHDTFTLSDSDRVLLSQQARRHAAHLARRLAAYPGHAYDIYLAGLNAIPGIMARYVPGDTMGFYHAIDWPLRNAMVSASVELLHTPECTELPSTLRRVMETGHLL